MTENNMMIARLHAVSSLLSSASPEHADEYARLCRTLSEELVKAQALAHAGGPYTDLSLHVNRARATHTVLVRDIEALEDTRTEDARALCNAVDAIICDLERATQMLGKTLARSSGSGLTQQRQSRPLFAQA